MYGVLALGLSYDPRDHSWRVTKDTSWLLDRPLEGIPAFVKQQGDPTGRGFVWTDRGPGY